MKKINLSVFFLFFFFILAFSSCKKADDTTNLGGDIIPGVDGITTFETSLTVEAYNGLFTALDDSLGIGRNDDHFAGNIFNDPLFGKTNAKIFLELKPSFYPFTFSNIINKDSLFFDSTVLVLGWHGTYGDTLAPQRFRVYEMDQSNNFRTDSLYQVRQQSFTYSNQLGSKDFFPSSLKDSVKVFSDTTRNQLRIKLNNAFGEKLLKGPGFDSTMAYSSDSAFKTYLRGFAIEADQSFGNAIISFGLVNEPNTKLAIYYRYRKGGVDVPAVSYFNFTIASAQHNFIDRNFSGSPLLAAQGGSTPDNLVYLINAPGSYATLKIPELRNFNNCIVHRAELSMEEVYDVSDKNFFPPQALFLDLYDSSISKYKIVPYDYILDNTGAGQSNFGIFGKSSVDGFGNTIRTWKFNITRYVQNVLTKKEPLHNLRLLAHRYVIDQAKNRNPTNSGSYVTVPIQINSLMAIGRVRLAGGTYPTQKMKLRIIYSKI